jgi:hypothetical protein
MHMRRRNRSGSAATGRKLIGWKALGLASIVGVAATGVVIARAERRRRGYTPDEVRAQLHTRHAEADRAPTAASVDDGRR